MLTYDEFVCFHVMLKMICAVCFHLQGAGIALRPHLSDLVCCMLESLSSLEDQGLNYVEVSFNVRNSDLNLCLILTSY